MKKTVLILLFSLLLISISQAQIIEKYGIKLGGTMSNQSWDYDISGFEFETEYLLGINLGLFAELLKNSNFCLVAEINFVQKGMKEELDDATWLSVSSNGHETWETRINYINISALARYNLDFNSFKPYLLLGPKIDYEISKSFSENYIPTVEDEFSKLRVGVKVGVGSGLDFLSNKLFFEFLYDKDFNSLYDNGTLNINSYSFDFRLGLYL